MKIWQYQEIGCQEALNDLINRSEKDFQEQDSAVREILEDVHQNRDKALLKYTNRFDRTDYRPEDLEVLPDEIKKAYSMIASEELEALKIATENIKKFHQK